MNRYFLPVFMMTITFSLAASSTAYCDSSQSSATSSSYQSSSVTSIQNMGSLNDQALSSSGEVIIGADNASSVLPKLSLSTGGSSAVTVFNPSPKPVTFSAPGINVSCEIPANAQRTIQIDRAQTASLTAGQEVAYYINDSQGNVIASSSFINNQEVASMINVNREVASTETTETETTATTEQRQSKMTRRAAVRGFW